MTDQPPSVAAPVRVLDAQLIVSCAIVGAMTILAAGMIFVAWSLRDWTAASALGVGTIIGALATALNAPSGIASALRAAKPGASQ